MSTILVDSISDTAGTGAPSFPNGLAGDGSGLTSLTSANLTGALPAISGSSLTSLTSANLTGALPAISGSSLTSLTSANLTGALPAIDGSNLTGIAGIPSGAVIYHAANTAPTGFIKANGASISTSTYSDLFAVIGYTFGGSGGSFNVPDLRGEFLRGWDDGRGVDSGRGFGSTQADEFKSHNHGIQTWTQYIAGPQPNKVYNGGGYAASYVVNTASTGGTETRPRNIALLACIKY